MPELDYTAAVEAAAEAMFQALTGFVWIDQEGRIKYVWREQALPLVLAAAPEIARQAWDEGYGKGNLDGYFGTGDEQNPWGGDRA